MIARRGTLLVLTVLLISALLPPVSAAPATHLTILTASVGGVFYPLGVALARLISSNIPGVEAAAQITSGSVENLQVIASRRADLAFTQADVAYAAFKGLNPFAGPPVSLQTLVPLYNSFTQLVTLEGTGITKVTDLRGKRVSLGPPQSGTQVTAIRILKAAGIDPDRDIRKEQLGVTPSAAALEERSIDAFFWIGGVHTPAIQDLATRAKVRMRLVPLDSVLPALQKAYSAPSGPLYFKVIILKKFYQGTPADTPTVGLGNLLVSHSSFSATLAYQITRLIFERRDELAQSAPEAEDITLLDVAERSPLPLHPGAIRYFRERGVKGF